MERPRLTKGFLKVRSEPILSYFGNGAFAVESTNQRENAVCHPFQGSSSVKLLIPNRVQPFMAEILIKAKGIVSILGSIERQCPKIDDNAATNGLFG